MGAKTDRAVAPAAGWRALWPASAGRDIVGGFNAAMIGLPYTIGLGIVAAGPAAGYRISAEAFAVLKREQPQLALKILSNLCLIMSARMRAANRMITELEG